MKVSIMFIIIHYFLSNKYATIIDKEAHGIGPE